MTKRILSVCLFCVIPLSAFCLLTVFLPSDIGMAQPISDGARKPVQTINCASIKDLNTRLKNAPGDPDILFQLGVCLIKNGRHALAHKVFDRAFRVDSRYGSRIARQYMTAGHKQLQDGRIRQCRILFQKAVRFDPRLRADIAKDAFQQGKWLFGRGLYDAADERFAIANSLDDSYRTEICDMYFTLGNALDRKKCLELYRLASWYCSDHNEEIGLRLLEIAKNQTSKKYKALYRTEAGKYVSEQTLQAVLPTPSWKTVYASAYIGKGYDAANRPQYHIRTVQFGREVKKGDKILVETQGSFRIWDAGWDEYESEMEIIPKNRADGQYLYVEGPKEKKILITVQRYY